jgi:hypothetical protein
MRSTGAICDPDSVLSEQQRYRINYELSQLESRTRQPHGRDFCEKKGVTAAVALAKHVRGASENAVKSMANDMLRRWTLDTQCKKSIVIVMATEDRKFWVARDTRVPVYGAEFTDLFNEQKPLFAQRNYQQALMNIVQGTWEKAIAKQGPAEEPSDGGRQTPFTPSKPDRGGEDRGRGHRPSSGKGFSIPMWFWLVLVLVVIPTVLCCCCIYCCCCRKKGGGERRQGPSDHPDPEAGGRRGGGGGGFGNILGGIGAGAIANQIGGFLRGKGNRGGNAPADPPPPYVEPTPNAGGRGLCARPTTVRKQGWARTLPIRGGEGRGRRR